MAFGDDVAQRGWQTGSVVSADLVPHVEQYLARPDRPRVVLAAEDWLVVVSQTCDVQATKLAAEPYVEVLHCRPVAGKPRKDRRDLRSTRYLDFRPNRSTHADLVLTAHAIADRYILPREACFSQALAQGSWMCTQLRDQLVERCAYDRLIDSLGRQ